MLDRYTSSPTVLNFFSVSSSGRNRCRFCSDFFQNPRWRITVLFLQIERTLFSSKMFFYHFMFPCHSKAFECDDNRQRPQAKYGSHQDRSECSDLMWDWGQTPGQRAWMLPAGRHEISPIHPDFSPMRKIFITNLLTFSMSNIGSTQLCINLLKITKLSNKTRTSQILNKYAMAILHFLILFVLSSKNYLSL